MKFSFLLLTWNRQVFLKKCLESLLESIENLEDTEIVVMDNGSTDGTAEYLSSYETHPNFRIYKLKKNYGLSSYKKLLRKAKGDYLVVVDDDVLAFPANIKEIFESYLTAFPDYGYLALDVIQNEFTNGAKPESEHYIEDIRDEKIVQRGPTGGWCSCFRRSDYRKIRFHFYFKTIDMKESEDYFLTKLIDDVLGLKSGIIKGKTCFHASGPFYSKEYGYLERDIEKYLSAGLNNFVEIYENEKE